MKTCLLTQDHLEQLAFKNGGDVEYTADTVFYQLGDTQYYAPLERVPS